MEQNTSETKFILTGFGEFYGVVDNPTKALIESLQDHEKNELAVIHAEVLEVSIQGVDTYIDQVKELVKNHDTKPTNFVFIHFGVDAGSYNFVLEQKGYNQKHFSCPDMRNNKPCQEKIAHDYNLDHQLCSELDLAEVQKLILNESESIIKKKDIFKLGVNPGRYICNYIYFKSLHCLQCENQTNGSKIYSLFVHCPPFTRVKQEDQKKLVFLLIKSIYSTLNNKKQC